MTREDTIKVLAILKAAYPASYRNMTKDEANGTVNIWATQFANIPYEVVSIAVNKLISTNTFPPSISEVKEKIRGLYWEAMQEIPYQYGGVIANNTEEIDPKKLAILKEIVRVTEPMRTRINVEPSLSDLLSGYNTYLTGDECAVTKQTEGESKK